MNRLALFDCDGTLIDSQHNICTAADACFAANGLEPPDHHAVRRGVGLHVRDAMARLAPQWADAAFIDKLAADYKAAYTSLTQHHSYQTGHLYDGIIGLLDALEADGWLLAIATGNSDRGLARILDHHGLERRFISLQTADRHPSKPHPSMAWTALADAGADPVASIMIGDTSYDMEMAKAVGMVAIGVDWGYHEPAILRAAGADHIATQPDEIRTFI